LRAGPMSFAILRSQSAATLNVRTSTPRVAASFGPRLARSSTLPELAGSCPAFSIREAEGGAAAGAPPYMELSIFTAAPIELVGGPGGGAPAGAPPPHQTA